jgi:hypothetical protein
MYSSGETCESVVNFTHDCFREIVHVGIEIDSESFEQIEKALVKKTRVENSTSRDE